MSTIEVICFSCGHKNQVSERVGRRDECSSCMADLHVCKNCRFYDPGAYNECKESSADVVREKEESNFCDFFEVGAGNYSASKKDELLAQAEALFGKKDG
ncbi:MAG: hypothetical protein AAF203_07525 [Pseudomonadota bacterium]